MIRIINFFYTIPGGNSSFLLQESQKVAEPQDLGPVLEPGRIGFSFDTPGWYVLGSLILLGLFYASYRWIKKYRTNAYRREALNEVLALKEQGHEMDFTAQLSAIMAILKNVALKAYGRNSVATLHGNSWLLFLESKSDDINFSHFEPMISSAIYENQTPEPNELNELRNLSIKWIKTHA